MVRSDTPAATGAAFWVGAHPAAAVQAHARFVSSARTPRGADQDLGWIEVGKLADLMVLNSNPLDNIRNTLDMKYVMKGGILYDSETLDEIWPEKRPFGPYYWVDKNALKADEIPFDVWKRR